MYRPCSHCEGKQYDEDYCPEICTYGECRKRLKELEEAMKHGRWIAEKGQTLITVEYDNDGNPILHGYVVYRCDQCGRTAKVEEPYCHCGAKMDIAE